MLRSPRSPSPPTSLRFLALLLLLTSAGSGPARAELTPPPVGPRGERLIDLGLAYRLAVAHSPSLTMLDQRVAQAAAVRRAAWAAVLPVAGLSGSFTHFDQEVALDFGAFMPPGVTVPDPIVIQQRNQFAFNVQATLPLLRGQAYPRIGAAGKQLDVARKQRIRTRQDFLLRVARAYYQVLSQRDVVKAVANKVDVDRKNLAAATARFEVGKTPRSDKLRADLELTQDEQTLRRETNLLSANKRQLAILLGLPGSVAVRQPPDATAPGGDLRHQLGTALHARADYRASAVSIAASRQQRTSAWLALAPTLDLTWLYHWQEAAGFSDRQGSWSLIFGLAFPIYDGGLRYAQIRQARAKVGIAEAERRQLAQDIEQQIVQLRAELASAEAGVITAAKAVALARTTVEDMTARYEAGTATQLELLDAAQKRLEAELQQTRSHLIRELARLALAHAMGKFDPVPERES